jgi:quercetin dioxygenase-like cupin family protein
MLSVSASPARRESLAMPGTSGRQIQIGALSVVFHVDPNQVDGSVTVFECFAPAHARMPAPHSHDNFDETVFGLEGVTTFMVAGEQIDLHVGESQFIQRGVVHGFDNRGDDDARFLAIITPGLLGPSYFEEIAAVVAGGGPPDIEKIGEVMRRHGLTPAPPA